MAVRRILQYPNEVLKKTSEPIGAFDGETAALINDLVETMEASPGVGLAACQVGVLKRVVVVDVTPKSRGHGLLILVNPEITEKTGRKIVREGCLSVPEYTANIGRAETVTVKALDREGKEFEFTSEGFEAIAVQHELDHLDGVLFIDRIESVKALFKRKVKGGKG